MITTLNVQGKLTLGKTIDECATFVLLQVLVGIQRNDDDDNDDNDDDDDDNNNNNYNSNLHLLGPAETLSWNTLFFNKKNKKNKKKDLKNKQKNY